MKGFERRVTGVVPREWIDHNGHMNVVHYFALFERTSHAIWTEFAQDAGVTPDFSMVAGRFFIEHRRELMEGDSWELWSAVAGVDTGRLTLVHRLSAPAPDSGWPPIAASCEVLASGFSMASRQAVPLPEKLVAKVRERLLTGYRSRLGAPSAGESGGETTRDVNPVNGAAPADWQVVILMIEGKANHVGILAPGIGFADLSLAGARIVQLDDKKFPKGIPETYPIRVPHPARALEFLSRSGALCGEIIDQERAMRGWSFTPDAPDYVLNLRNSRSRDPKNMNCVEWIVYALECGGLKVPDDVLTPTQLRDWCRNRGTKA